MKKLEEYVRSIPDFPEPGVIFRDVTSILQDADGLRLAVDSLQELLEGVDFDVIVGTESRGFIFGVPVAYNLHKPCVPVRKKGKLPCETVEASYAQRRHQTGTEGGAGGRSDSYGRNDRSLCQDGGKPGRRGGQDHLCNGTGRTAREREAGKV